MTQRSRSMTRMATAAVVVMLVSVVALVAEQRSGAQTSPPQMTAGSPDALLGEALHEEEVEGRLQNAIALYQRVLKAPGVTKAQAARAQFRIGACYERLGLGEARKAYEAVVANYSDQTEIVAQARGRLATLGGPSPTTLTARRLENPPADASNGEVSPDGRYLSFRDWQTGDLAVRDLQTGKDRRLTSEGTSWDEGSAVPQQAWESTWSPDSKHIAYAWIIGSGYIGSGAQVRVVELRIVGLDGGKPRVLSHYDSAEELGSLDWSPDAKHILAILSRKNGPRQMVLISTADGSTRVLTDIKREIFPTTAGFSPDSRYVAYDRLPDDTSPERDIFLMSIDSGQVTPLIQHPTDDYLLGWSADGKWIAFASDRTGALGLLAWLAGKHRESRNW